MSTATSNSAGGCWDVGRAAPSGDGRRRLLGVGAAAMSFGGGTSVGAAPSGDGGRRLLGVGAAVMSVVAVTSVGDAPLGDGRGRLVGVGREVGTRGWSRGAVGKAGTRG